jgi:hypothetical protein
VDADGEPVWRATHEIPQRDKSPVIFDVGVESRECPVALVKRDSLVLIQDFMRAQRVKEAGGVLYGPDSAQWPVRWFDAVDLIQVELENEERARNAAIYHG